MADRAHLLWQWTDELGNIIPAADVEVFEPGTTTKIAQTIYVNDDPDTSVYPNPFKSDANGIASFFLVNSRRVDLRFSKTGYDTKTIPSLDATKSSVGVNTVQDEGAPLTTRDILNFTGAGVTATDDAANGRTNVTIAGGTGETVAASTIWDAKGDLAVGTAADTAARKAVGSNGAFLLADSGQTDGLRYALPTGAVVDTDETTTSTTYTDLATAGPAATATVGASGMALVLLSGEVRNAGAGQGCQISVAVSGATTLAAADNISARFDSASASAVGTVSRPILLTGLTAGSNTFTAKYKVTGAATGNFRYRRVAVIPL